MKRAFPLSLAAAALLAALAGCGQTPPAPPAGASSGGPASSWSQDGGPLRRTDRRLLGPLLGSFQRTGG